MSLPKIVVQKHHLTLPLSNVEIEVQPYLTKHERLLLKAQESKNNKEIIAAIEQILEDCTFGYKVKDLPMADIEYLLVKLKAFSSGELVELAFRCHNEIDGSKCNERVELAINLDEELQFDNTQLKDNRIELGIDNIGIMMKPPSFKIFDKLLKTESEADQLFDVIADCIDYVWQDDEMFRDWNRKEMQEFLDSLSSKQMQQIREYIESIPSLKVEKEFNCPKCGYKEDLVLKDIFDFFT